MPSDLVIIGAGIAGLCSAYYARRRGLSVTVLERNAAGADACSTGNAGMIVPGDFVPLASPGMISTGLRSMWNPESPFYLRPRADPDLVEWCWRFFRASNAKRADAAGPILTAAQMDSRALFVALSEQAGLDFGLQQRGLTMICATPHALEKKAALLDKAKALGTRATLLDADGVRALNPGVEIACLGGLHFPDDCFLDPRRLLEALHRAVEDAGVEIRHGVSVTGWQRRGRVIRAVQTDHGEVEGKQFALAAGSWSPRVSAGLDAHLPMQAGKGYSMTLEQPPAMPTVSAILVEAKVAVTPMGRRLRFGGTMEITGLDESISQRRVDGIIKSAGQYFPQFPASAFAGTPVWRGLRPCSPDGLPFVGRLRKHDNVLVATGHAMLGVSMGPITGEIIAKLANGDKPPAYAAAFDPDRYN